jgi:hypothetical protein
MPSLILEEAEATGYFSINHMKEFQLRESMFLQKICLDGVRFNLKPSRETQSFIKTYNSVKDIEISELRKFIYKNLPSPQANEPGEFEQVCKFDKIASLFAIEPVNRSIIKEYLNKKPILYEILFEAGSKIPKYVMGYGKPILKFFKNQEEPDDKFLYILIKVNKPIEEILALTRKIYEDWFFDCIEKTEGELNLFIEPL